MSRGCLPSASAGIAARAALVALTLLCGLPGLQAVPPVDRDEPRFAQASKQMVESGDFIDVRFQDEPRHKKPVLIYWLQAGSARVFGGPALDRIGAYRLPSLLASVLAVLFTFEAGCLLFGSRTAFTGAALLAATVLFQSQSHQARADALLLACVTACLWPLARAWLAGHTAAADARPSAAEPAGAPAPGLVATFWLGLAAGILTKGPIAPAWVALTVAALVAADWRTAWLRGLRPGVGIVLLLLVIAPWPVALWLQQGPGFFVDAWRGDVLPKLAGGQESHGAPPLSYLASLPLTFWPATVLLPLTVVHAWRCRARPAVRFCLAAVVPAWVLFELVPTKLPHYVLPVFPALALLAAAAASSPADDAGSRAAARIGALLSATASMLVVGLIAFAALRFGRGIDAATGVTLLVVGVVAFATAVAAWRQRWRGARVASIAAGVLVSVTAFGMVAPSLDRAWVAARAASAIRAPGAGQGGVVAVCGYREPSLVFLLGTGTRFVSPPQAAAGLATGDYTAVIVRDDLQSAFLGAARARGWEPARVASISGTDPVHGQPLVLTVWRRQRAA